MVISEEARFLQHVRKTEGCWFWTGPLTGSKHKYGYFAFGGKQTYAHRWAHTQWVGPIPEGYEVDHVKARGCGTLICVNPAHLEAVTPAENMRRERLAFCQRGHDLNVLENVTFDSKGRRRGCAECRRYHAREAVRRKKESQGVFMQ